MNTELYNTIIANNHPDDGPLKRLSHPVIGSCNSLVCFYVYHDNIQDPVYIINPETGQYIHLPQKYMLPEECVGRINVLGGFGYCRSSDQYKVVRIDPDGKLEVNTLGDKMGWRNVEHIYVCFCGGESGVYANGCIFWLVYKDTIKELLSFNLRSETFSTHSLPPNHIPGGNVPVDQFPAVGMMLFWVTLFVYNMHSQQENRIYFWTLDENNKDLSTPADEPGHLIWRRRFSINLPKQNNDWLTYNPIALGNNNDVLLWDN
ncbi:putative F-box protein At1g71320 [Papaver somniferum]|uniref:putative F-box protein At1g71320 n=1 Tax=Papaver somniferum TaxID=3469 RepID=UPI000E701262|nr:putative F-box protein At1g71320 [Papaver somniferum]